jgi:hypothetical protein
MTPPSTAIFDGRSYSQMLPEKSLPGVVLAYNKIGSFDMDWLFDAAHQCINRYSSFCLGVCADAAEDKSKAPEDSQPRLCNRPSCYMLAAEAAPKTAHAWTELADVARERGDREHALDFIAFAYHVHDVARMNQLAFWGA